MLSGSSSANDVASNRNILSTKSTKNVGAALAAIIAAKAAPTYQIQMKCVEDTLRQTHSPDLRSTHFTHQLLMRFLQSLIHHALYLLRVA
ncbi:hypothetical protein [Methylobacter svalbardensis]|uniref:hypothetical protein n=1 Tax=Methylobacter svalbardensis TaxID=3080016 RepID=UPI0030EE432C